MLEQAKNTYSSLGKVFVKQGKSIEDPGKNYIVALEVLKPIEQQQQKPKSIEDIFPK